jgi:hypothetical protein
MLIRSVRVAAILLGADFAAGLLFLPSCASSPSPAEVQQREHDQAVLTLQRIREAVEKELAAYEPTAPRVVIPPGVPAFTAIVTITLDGFGAPVGVDELRRNCLNALPELQRIEEEAGREPLLSPPGYGMLVKRAEAAIVRTLTGAAYAQWQVSWPLRPPEAEDLDFLSRQDRSARSAKN